jgi:hypothetical protein
MVKWADDLNYMMLATTASCGAGGHDNNNQFGLACGHAYSLIGANLVTDDRGK